MKKGKNDELKIALTKIQDNETKNYNQNIFNLNTSSNEGEELQSGKTTEKANDLYETVWHIKRIVRRGAWKHCQPLLYNNRNNSKDSI